MSAASPEVDHVFKATQVMFEELDAAARRSFISMVVDANMVVDHPFYISLSNRLNRKIETNKKQAEKIRELTNRLDDYRCCNVKFNVCDKCGEETEEWS